MKRKLSVDGLKIILVALFYLAAFECRGDFCLAAAPESAGNVGRIEAVVIHVDEYAVYVPNLIFYFDTKMEKRKIEATTRVANQLRNRKALITYISTEGDISKDKHLLLSDIASPEERRNLEKTEAEAVPSVGAQSEPSRKPPEELQSPIEVGNEEPNGSLEKMVTLEKQPSRKTGLSDPITKEEISAFVNRILLLNDRKDLQAVASLYADKVDYYDRGVIGKDRVLQDLKYYFRNWVNIDTQLEGDIVMAGFEPDVRIVKFISSFSVSNQKKSITGRTENIWRIQRIDGELKLIDVKQKILAKDSSSQSEPTNSH